MDILGFNEELDKILATLEYEENGSVSIAAVEWHSPQLQIRLMVKTGVADEEQSWQISVRDARRNVITLGFANTVKLFDDHPLLWQYTQLQTELYFAKPADHPAELFFNVYTAHAALAQRWIPVDAFINNSLSITDLCKSRSALFARGPANLLAAYEVVLFDHGMNPSHTDSRPPKRWVEDRYVEESQRLKVLIIGDSFVVGAEFDFMKMERT